MGVKKQNTPYDIEVENLSLRNIENHSCITFVDEFKFNLHYFLLPTSDSLLAACLKYIETKPNTSFRSLSYHIEVSSPKEQPQVKTKLEYLIRILFLFSNNTKLKIRNNNRHVYPEKQYPSKNLTSYFTPCFA